MEFIKKITNIKKSFFTFSLIQSNMKLTCDNFFNKTEYQNVAFLSLQKNVKKNKTLGYPVSSLSYLNNLRFILTWDWDSSVVNPEPQQLNYKTRNMNMNTKSLTILPLTRCELVKE